MSLRLKADIDRALVTAVARQGIDVLARTFSKTQAGDPLHACVFRGTRIYARFEQQPPKGSIPLESGPRDYWGNLFFLGPDATIWTVPNIWYNNTWRHRIEELTHRLQWSREKMQRDREELVLIRDHKGAEAECARRNLSADISAREYGISRLDLVLRHIKEHAVDILDQCPHLAPIPRHYYE